MTSSIGRRTFQALAWTFLIAHAVAADPAPPDLSLSHSNGQVRLRWIPYPAAQAYQVQSSSSAAGPFTNDNRGTLNPDSFLATNGNGQTFYRLQITPLSSNALLSANVLNRLAYGPTPDELERIAQIGPQAYIDEQLAPENIVDPEFVEGSYRSETTNGVAGGVSGPPWRYVEFTGTATSSNLYLYLTAPGEAYIDDISLVAGRDTTNGTNLLVNSGFETPTLVNWTVPANMVGSGVSTNYKYSGKQSLRMVASSAGSAATTSITQLFPSNLTNGQQCTLSFWYLQTTNSSRIQARLSGSGVVASGSDLPSRGPEWIYATATGNATATPTLYIYPNGAGTFYIDDIKLVRGTVPEAGTNHLRNGDFESALTGPWTVTSDFTNSYITAELSHSGSGSLKLRATAAGTGSGDSIYQATIPGVSNAVTYTISFWYLPVSSHRTLTVRLSGSGLNATPDNTVSGIQRRLSSLARPSPDDGSITASNIGGANLADLRAWFVMNATGGKRQLLEVLTQFLENHFVTQHGKSVDYLDRYYDDFNLLDLLATDWEYREIRKWREALLRPQCTFYDLLKISAESPAMIVYLDTVDSRGNANNIANENYAREIFELFCMGVDNGYDQNDIVAQSRAWTGWSVELVDPEQMNNPFAAASTRNGFYAGVGSSSKSNLVGVWTFNYKSANHGTNRAPLFSIWSTNSTPTNLIALGPKLVPNRFGAPWAGMNYQLNISRTRTGTNTIQDGYDVARHLADLPFTMEYISVKLCRLFVHDDFVHGVYDYADPNRPAEAELVRQCMMAWWNSSPRGQLRPVLQTIFNSDLFRRHGSSMQKVKTPLEFTVSAMRALRSTNASGIATASTDGYSISGRSRNPSSAPLTRIGSMMLFDRDSPDGYPETAPPWVSAGTLAERIRFVQTALMAPADATKTDGISGGNFNLTDPVALLKKKLPTSSWNNVNDVATYFVGILYPGEGLGNLEGYRQLAVKFLETDTNGTTYSAFLNLNNTSTAYDTRVRGMVAMLMSQQRFQEQ